MTNLEALISVVRVNFPANSFEKALLDRDVTGSDDYTKANAEIIDLCTIDLLTGLLSEPDISEGGYSIKLDRAAVMKQVLFLAGKHNVTEVLDQYNPAPTVTPSLW